MVRKPKGEVRGLMLCQLWWGMKSWDMALGERT